MAKKEKRNPMAWLVFCGPGEEYDYLVYTDQTEAEDNAADRDDEVVPLFPASDCTRV
jgi:hypothetical protein